MLITFFFISVEIARKENKYSSLLSAGNDNPFGEHSSNPFGEEEHSLNPFGDEDGMGENEGEEEDGKRGGRDEGEKGGVSSTADNEKKRYVTID